MKTPFPYTTLARSLVAFVALCVLGLAACQPPRGLMAAAAEAGTPIEPTESAGAADD